LVSLSSGCASSYGLCGDCKKIDGRNAYVVAFTQTAGLVHTPAEIRLGDTSFPMLYQGNAWIDESSFRILRLRTDLLAPQPEAQLQKN